MSTTIDNDLETRRLRNEQRDNGLKLVERWVWALKIDWEGFHERHSHCVDIPCNGTASAAKRVLAKMGLNKEAIEICLLYFAEIGGECDCEIALNVDMTDPRPLSDFKCHDCGNDFDEYSYIVHDHVWDATGLSRDGGLLCVGCLERRIGRRLCSEDFEDVPLNRWTDSQSLRLQDRMNGTNAAD